MSLRLGPAPTTAHRWHGPGLSASGRARPARCRPTPAPTGRIPPARREWQRNGTSASNAPASSRSPATARASPPLRLLPWTATRPGSTSVNARTASTARTESASCRPRLDREGCPSQQAEQHDDERGEHPHDHGAGATAIASMPVPRGSRRESMTARLIALEQRNRGVRTAAARSSTVGPPSASSTVTTSSGAPPGTTPVATADTSRRSSTAPAAPRSEATQPVRSSARNSRARSRSASGSPATCRRRCVTPVLNAAGVVTSGRLSTPTERLTTSISPNRPNTPAPKMAIWSADAARRRTRLIPSGPASPHPPPRVGCHPYVQPTRPVHDLRVGGATRCPSLTPAEGTTGPDLWAPPRVTAGAARSRAQVRRSRFAQNRWSEVRAVRPRERACFVDEHLCEQGRSPTSALAVGALWSLRSHGALQRAAASAARRCTRVTSRWGSASH